MRLKSIVKSFALAGLLSSTALTPLFAQEAQKVPLLQPSKLTMRFITNFLSLITPISRMPIKALLLIYLQR